LGYPPECISFEYLEQTPLFKIEIDLRIMVPPVPKIFIEVKKTKEELAKLISGVKAYGFTGVRLDIKNRNDDPFKKAKCIVAGHPDYFVGYSPEGFDSYKVIYESENHFSLVPTVILSSSSISRRRRLLPRTPISTYGKTAADVPSVVVLQRPKSKQKDSENDKGKKKSYLDIALQMAIRCEETETQQGVEVPIASWEELQQYKTEVCSYIEEYNYAATKPIQNASPWAWRVRSGGYPLTENGRRFGVELRFSFSRKGNRKVAT
jgi:hypothetical protein